MPHFYVEPENISGNFFLINGTQYHYVSNVHRFKINDEIMIFDGIGNSYKAKIISINKNKIIGHILSSSYKMPVFTIKLYTSVPKGKRFEWLIEKCAEIGVSKIIPINTRRSLKIFFSENKLERYKKISIAASSQCGRNDIMEISNVLNFKNACKAIYSIKNFMSILLWEKETSTTLNNFIQKPTYVGANIFIGPEGGFENEEIEFAKSLDIQTITLGNDILRIETAALISSALVLNNQTLVLKNMVSLK
jgi:16S rRNA (uracil1498-N3)-methyltransferase